MRPTTVLWLFSSVLLLANAAPVPVRLVGSGPLTILKLTRPISSAEVVCIGENQGTGRDNPASQSDSQTSRASSPTHQGDGQAGSPTDSSESQAYQRDSQAYRSGTDKHIVQTGGGNRGRQSMPLQARCQDRCQATSY